MVKIPDEFVQTVIDAIIKRCLEAERKLADEKALAAADRLIGRAGNGQGR